MGEHFYNTTKEPIQTALEFDVKACNQERLILDFLFKHPGKYYSAEAIQVQVFSFPIPPRSSMARALTNLTKRNLIVKSETAQGISQYNRACYEWRFNNG